MQERLVLVAGALVAVVTMGLFARAEVEPADDPGSAHLAEQADGAWQPMAAAPIGSRRDHVAVWTGRCLDDAPARACGELLVWGGRDGAVTPADGAAYHPSTDTWRHLPDAPRAPLARARVPGVWTGGELVVWGATAADLDGDPGQAGGQHEDAEETDEPHGVAYDPVADAWRALPPAPIVPRVGHRLTWTGAEVVVRGGREVRRGAAAAPATDGAAYAPSRDAWRRLSPSELDRAASPTSPAGLAPRGWVPEAGASATWAETMLLAWGGEGAGAVWDPNAPPGEVVAPHQPMASRLADLPAGSETNWSLRAAPHTVEVRSDHVAVVGVWLSAPGQSGIRPARFDPVATRCAGRRCWHRFEPLPGLPPGPLRLHLRAERDAGVVVSVRER